MSSLLKTENDTVPAGFADDENYAANNASRVLMHCCVGQEAVFQQVRQATKHVQRHSMHAWQQSAVQPAAGHLNSITCFSGISTHLMHAMAWLPDGDSGAGGSEKRRWRWHLCPSFYAAVCSCPGAAGAAAHAIDQRPPIDSARLSLCGGCERMVCALPAAACPERGGPIVSPTVSPGVCTHSFSTLMADQAIAVLEASSLRRPLSVAASGNFSCTRP